MENSIQQDEARIQVPEETINAWKTKFRQGDKKKIATLAGTNRNRVSDAFQGLATPSLIKVISTYYKIAA